MGISEKVVNVIIKLMERWKTRLDVTESGKVLTSRTINIRKGFLQGDIYFPVGFCVTEVPVSTLIEETDGYTIGQRGKENVKRTHSIFIYDLNIYQDSHQKSEVVNEMFVKASMDTGACYGLKKCADILFRKGNIIKEEEWAVLEEKLDTLDSNKNEIYKFLGCEQAYKTDVKQVQKRVKKEMKNQLDHLTGLNLYAQNVMKTTNCRVTPVAGCVINEYSLGKGILDELDMIVESV